MGRFSVVNGHLTFKSKDAVLKAKDSVFVRRDNSGTVANIASRIGSL